MTPMINLTIQMEHDPERAIRQVENLARQKSAGSRSGKHPWFSRIITVLTMRVSRMFSSGYGRIKRKAESKKFSHQAQPVAATKGNTYDTV
jgi:hypothetical protein